MKGREGEPRLPVEKPSRPAWLKGEALLEWKRQVRQLMRMNVLAKCDRAALAMYCEAWGEFVQAVELLDKSGLLLKGGDGVLRRNPLLAVRNAAADRLLRLAGQFGFTPAARTKLREVQGGEEQENPKARFFSDAG